MKYWTGLLSLFLLFLNSFSVGQERTIGLLQTSNKVNEGYTLFAPIFGRETYLIDKCGYEIHKWPSPLPPGQTSFLSNEGLLLRTLRVPGVLTGGGVGGRMQLVDWDGNVLWSYDIANDSLQQHHTAIPLPDGTIMAAIWKRYSKEAAIQKGFDPTKLTAAGIVSDMVIHFRPVGNRDIEILWQWDFWDHTVQERSSQLSDFGVVSEHPELLDVNFFEDPGANPAEWIHLNSIDYDPVRDLVMVSSKFHNEIYIIDHSTTTAEAMGHTGGRYGKGGDFIFRWGNPRSYGRGTRDDHWLYGQHDVQFIDEGLPGAGNILLFNNGSNRTDSIYSVAEEIVPQLNEDGTYKMSSEGRYLPFSPAWSYPKMPELIFYSSRISSVQRLKNGNTLLCEGNKGLFTEVDTDGKVVWKYKNPVNNFGASFQGLEPQNTDVFTIRRYTPDFSGFADKTLTPGLPLENGNMPEFCEQLNPVDETKKNEEVTVFPNPAVDYIYLKGETGEGDFGYFEVVSGQGQIVSSGNYFPGRKIDISSHTPGLYMFRLIKNNSIKKINFAFLKF